MSSIAGEEWIEGPLCSLHILRVHILEHVYDEYVGRMWRVHYLWVMLSREVPNAHPSAVLRFYSLSTSPPKTVKPEILPLLPTYFLLDLTCLVLCAGFDHPILNQ